MKFEFLEKKDYNLIDALVSELGLSNYEIDYDAKFLVARNGSARILGCVAVNMHTNELHPYPHLQHLILRKDTSRKTGMKLLRKAEQYLKDGNYREYTCYIDNARNKLQVMAMRFGFRAYANDEFGVWFYKQLRR